MFRSILVPIGLAHPSSWEAALPQAVELATASGGAVTVMTVLRDTRTMFEGSFFPLQLEGLMSEAQEKLKHIAAAHRSDRVAVACDVRFGSIGHEILTAAADLKVDLIVMASHRPEMRDYLIGPNAAHVARHATCSVLVLRRAETNV